MVQVGSLQEPDLKVSVPVTQPFLFNLTQEGAMRPASRTLARAIIPRMLTYRPFAKIVFAGLLSFLFVLSALAQDKTPDKRENAAPAAQAMGQAATPGPPQEFLAKRAGEYTRVIKFVGQPGADAMQFSGTSKISVVLDGRFILEENSDVAFGRPVHGMRLWGYNNVTKQYEAVWTYTMSTAILMLTGTSSDGGKTIEYTGTTDEPNGKIPLHARVHQIDADNFVVALYSKTPDGKEAAFQETTYSRKK
jgi:hypothetical protein